MRSNIQIVQRFSLKMYNDDNELLIEFQDNGKGFDTKVASDGDGLKNIFSRADKINGQLEMISNDNGTKFILTCNLKTNFKNQETSNDILKTQNSIMITVAIVDDKRDIRDGLSLIINNAEGFKCLGTFSDGESAASGMKTLAPNVVLMDISLPRMNGIECVKELKEQMPDLDVIMLTCS